MRHAVAVLYVCTWLLMGLPSGLVAQSWWDKLALGSRTQTINWATGTQSGGALRGPGDVEVTVDGINPLCYQAQVLWTPITSDANVSGFVRVMDQSGGTGQGGEPPKAGEDTLPVDSLGDIPTVPLSVPGLDTVNPAAQARARVLTARTSFDAARAIILELDTLSQGVMLVSNEVHVPPCNQGRAFNFNILDSRLTATEESFLPLLREAENKYLEPAVNWIDNAVENAELAQSGLAQAIDALEGTARAQAEEEWEEIREEAEKLEAAANALRAEVDAVTARARTAEVSLVSAVAVVRDLRPASEMTVRINLPINADGGKLLIRSIPVRAGAANLSEMEHGVQVLRRHRVIVTAGVLVTFLDNPNFQRVNRPYVEVSGEGESVQVISTDSTFSTYGDVERSGLSAFSPAAQVHVSLVDLAQGIPVLASFGAAVRSVRTTAVEPTIGLSLGIADRLFVTWGVHYGRSQELLILHDNETKENLEQRPVPEAITPQDAVGIRWDWGGFLNFSVRP